MSLLLAILPSLAGGVAGFGEDGAVQTFSQATRVQNWTTQSVAIGKDSGNDRLLIVRLIFAGDDTDSITYNGVAGTLVESSLHSDAGVRIYAWADGDLPATAGSYNLVVSSGTATGSIGWIVAQPYFGAQQSGWVSASGLSASAASVATSTSVTPQNANARLLVGVRTDENDVLDSQVPSDATVELEDNGLGVFSNSFTAFTHTGDTSQVTPSATFTTTSLEMEIAAVLVEEEGTTGGTAPTAASYDDGTVVHNEYRNLFPLDRSTHDGSGTLSIDTAPTKGTAVLSGDSTWIQYRGDGASIGADSLVYTLTDGNGSDQGTIDLTRQATDHLAPVTGDTLAPATGDTLVG